MTYRPQGAKAEEADWRAVRAKVLGKTAVITDLPEEEVTSEKLGEGFVARAEVEEDFKGLKDGHVVSVKPFWVWHDATVAGHTFLCVMGLLLLRYLQWELRELDLSIKELVKELEKIRVVLVRGEDGKPQIEPGEFHPHLKASGVGPAIGVRTTTGFSPRNSLRCPGTAKAT